MSQFLRLLLRPVLVGTALVLLAAMPSFTLAASPAPPNVTLGHGATYARPGSGPTPLSPNRAFHLRGQATCPTGHFLYVQDGGIPSTMSGFAINADCSLTPVPGSPYPTGGNEYEAGWGQNQIATSMANGPCVFESDANGSNNSIGLVQSWSVASDGSLTKVSTIDIPAAGSDIKVSADGKYLYAVSWTTPASISTITVGSGCALTLAHTYTTSNSLYYAITLVGNKGLVAPDYNNDTIDVYSITNGTQLTLVSTTPSQVPYPGGAATVLRSPLGPLVFDGSNGAAEAEGHTINSQGILGTIPGSPASDPNSNVGANVFYDRSHGQITETEQFTNTLAIYGRQGNSFAFLSQVALPAGSFPFPTAQTELGSELYIVNELGASVVACAMGTGTATCSIAGTFPSGGIAQGIGVL